MSALYQSIISANYFKCQQESHQAAVIGSPFFFLIAQAIKLRLLSLRMYLSKQHKATCLSNRTTCHPTKTHAAAEH